MGDTWSNALAYCYSLLAHCALITCDWITDQLSGEVVYLQHYLVVCGWCHKNCCHHGAHSLYTTQPSTSLQCYSKPHTFFWSFECMLNYFHNAPNSDMDYSIFNLCLSLHGIPIYSIFNLCVSLHGIYIYIYSIFNLCISLHGISTVSLTCVYLCMVYLPTVSLTCVYLHRGPRFIVSTKGLVADISRKVKHPIRT